MPKRWGKKKTAKNEENRTRVENAANEKSTRQHCLLASAYWYLKKIFFFKVSTCLKYFEASFRTNSFFFEFSLLKEG